MRKDHSCRVGLFAVLLQIVTMHAEAQTTQPNPEAQTSKIDGSNPSLPPLPDATQPRLSTRGVVVPATEDSTFSAFTRPSSGPTTSLTGAIASALNANPDLVSATERIRIADATLSRARAEFYPKLTLAEAYLGTNIAGLAFFLEVNQRRVSPTQNFNHPGYVGNISTMLTFQQNVYSGGRRKAEELSAEEQRRASSCALAAARNEMIFRVAEAYFRIVQARELVESRSVAVNQIERHVALVRSRYDNGTAVRSDLLAVEVKLSEAKEGLITAGNQLELSWAILENVTGTSLPHILPAQTEPTPWAARVDAVESVITEAVGTRPELGASLSEIRGSTHKVDAARSGKRANVDFFANFSTFDMNRNSGGNGGIVGLIASINLFDGHRTKSDVVKAQARVRELQAQHRRLLMDIELEVRQAYLSLRDAEGRLSVSGEVIAQADQSQREIEDRYNDQKATITQLIDAQVASTGARVRRANAAADVEIAKAALQRVAGHLDVVFLR